MSFEAALARVLDPDGIYWSNADEHHCDPAADSLVQLRIDVPIDAVSCAVLQMKADGWKFTDQPDATGDPQQRLFFRRHQNLLPDTKTAMLTNALKIVFPIQGARLWTWIVIDDESKA